MSNSNSALIILLILVLVGAFVVFIPVAQVGVSGTLVTVTEGTIREGYYVRWERRLHKGSSIDFNYVLDSNVDAYIFTESQFNNYANGFSFDSEAVKRGDRVRRIEYSVLSSGTYYFVIEGGRMRARVSEISVTSAVKRVPIIVKLFQTYTG